MNEKKEYYHLTEQFTPVSNMIFATDGNGAYITVIGAIHDLNTLRHANECLEEERHHLYEVVRRCNVSIDIEKRINNNLHLDNLKLEKENKQLKKILGFLKNDNAEDILNVLNSQENKICELKQENEVLKQFQDRVFSWIDMNLQRLPTLRDDEFESDNEFADPSLYSGAIQILETMKRELKGDVE